MELRSLKKGGMVTTVANYRYGGTRVNPGEKQCKEERDLRKAGTWNDWDHQSYIDDCLFRGEPLPVKIP